jgi:GTP-binding protein
MIRTYLQSRETLRALVILFDIRRIPREEDIQLLDWLWTISRSTGLMRRIKAPTRSR